MILIKIVTVNIPESYIDSIEKLVGNNGLYPSRSELIRVAVRDFLLRELKMANNMAMYKEGEIEEFDEDKYVKVPIERLDEKDEPVREFKTYKIIKRLSINDSDIKPKEDHGESTWKKEFNRSLDPNPHIRNISLPSLHELRERFPNEPSYSFINERLE